MSYKELDPFNYMDINPQNYKSKQQLISDLEEISKVLENITNDWKEREISLQKIGSISKGNLNKSDIFIKNFNLKISTNLEIQLSDLRSSVMKEACRITSLCAMELGLLIEQGVTQLLTQNCLFKIAGSANKVISDSSSKCILNIVRYVHSLKVISSICEIKTMKANNVRILCAQCLVNIISYYENNFILKSKDIIESTIKSLLVDANAEVRATTRKAFILYKSRFDKEGENLFNELGKNVQKHINEDEKNFDSNFKIKLKHENEEKYIKSISKEIDENLNKMNYMELIQNKPKTPEFNLMKKKPNQGNKNENNNNYSNQNTKKLKSSGKYVNKKIKKNNEGKKEETVKYINVDDDDDVNGGNDVVNISLDDSNDNDEEKEKKEEEDNKNNESKEINAIFNYSNKPIKKIDNKNNDKKLFIKKNSMQNKKNEPETNNKITENKNINRNNSKKMAKSNKNIESELDPSQNLKIHLDFEDKNIKSDNNKNSNDINTFNIEDLINNKDKKGQNNGNKNNVMSNSSRTIKTISDIKSIVDSSQNIPNNKATAKSRKKEKINNELTKKTNLEYNSNKVNLIKSKHKFEQLDTGAIVPTKVGNSLQKNNFVKNYKKKGKSREKLNSINNEVKNPKNYNPKKISNSNFILSNISKKNKISDSNFLYKSTNFTLNENSDKAIEKMWPRQDEKNSNDFKLYNDNEENDLDEEIDTVFDIDLNKKKDWTKTFKHKKNNINNNLTKKESISPKSNTYRFNKSNNKNVNLISSGNYLNDALNNTNPINKNDENLLNNESIEEKIKIIIDKLDNLINQNEKLILFQYLFNYFNSTLNEINNFSSNTVKRYIEIHIENLKENDKNLVEQVIKNLMRMIFYMNNIFNTYEIESILKILLFSINDLNDKTITKLSNQLLEIIKKKCDNEELFKSVYSLLSEYNTNFDNCYEFMYLLMPECDNILNNSNYFKQVFRLICLTDNSSKRVGKIIDILYRKYTNNFNQAYDEETPENKKQILMFMEKTNSLYYREFKSIHEDQNNINKKNNEIDNNKIINITRQAKKENNNSIDKVNKESLNISINKNSNLDTSKTPTLSTNISNKNNIIYTQNNKSSSNINTINGNLGGNNIISINNSNNNNIIITNKLPDDSIPNDIKMSIQNNNLEQYISYMEEHKSYIPEFVLLLSNKKYNDSKSAITLLNFTQNLLNSNNFAIDLNTCINLLIKQLIYILTSHKKDEKISELIKNILSEMPIYLNSEKSLSTMAKFLTIDNDSFTLENLLLGIQNYIIKFKNIKGPNKNISLANLLDCFITEVFNLLKHQNSEIRKRAVYCCVEIHFAIGKEFETFLEKIPKNQQNLIKLFIKKRGV